jgi:D-glycero-D-manno-heptose 1,7-bisphosphate phosphatase
VFLDRDGVINAKPPEGAYICTWQGFRLLPAVVDWIRLFNALGLLVVVVTNQRGVALGLVTEEDLAEIHRNMAVQLAQAGAFIDDIFCCPHDKDSCNCRKPKPGLILQAQRRWNIDLSQSLVIGDSEADREMAAACGMKYVCVRDGRIIGTLAGSSTRAGLQAL